MHRNSFYIHGYYYPRSLPAEILRNSKKHGYGFPGANDSSYRHSSFFPFCSSSVRGNFRLHIQSLLTEVPLAGNLRSA